MVPKGGCAGWLRQRSNLEKTLLSLSSLLLLTLLLLVIVGIAYRKSQSEPTVENLRGSWDPDCIRTAGQLLTPMDPRADACADWYGYSCGRYGRTAGQTESVSKTSAQGVHFAAKRLLESGTDLDVEDFDSVRALYAACLDFDFTPGGRSPEALLRRLMLDFGVGQWPVIESFYDDPPLTLEQRLTALALLDVPVAFRMEVVPDQRVPDSFLVKVSPGGPRESRRPPSEIRSDVLLRDGMRTRFLRLGGSETRVASDVRDILDVDSYFAQAQQAVDDNCDTLDRIPPENAIKELQRLIPEANWSSIVSQVQASADLVRPFAVELLCKAKIRDYIMHLNEIPLRSTYNYLGWRFFSAFSEYMGPDFARREPGSPRWRHCLDLVERFAGPLLAEALARQMGPGAKEKVQKIVDSVMASTGRLLSKTQWLSSNQQSRIQKKISNLAVRLPFESKMISNRSLPVQIPEVELENFTSIVVNLHRQWVVNSFKSLSHQHPRQDFATRDSFLSAPASSFSNDKDVIIYFDQIGEPFLRFHGTDWLSYGGLGVSVARDVCRVLLEVDLGLSENDQMSLWDVWMRNKNASGCLLNSFDQRFGFDSEVERMNNLKDLFLDRCSLEIAYESGKASGGNTADDYLPGLDLNGQQMFFLSYAQSLCSVESPRDSSSTIPIRERVNAAVSGFRVFVESGQCEPSSASLCQLWT